MKLASAKVIEARLPQIYLVLALAITTLTAYVTAPFFAPDEANQSLRAITLGHGEWMPAVGATDEAGAPADTGAVAAMEDTNQIRMRWERRARDFHDRPYGPMSESDLRRIAAAEYTHRSAFVAFANTAVYPPFLYLPAIVGWRTGERFGWTVLTSLHCARWLCAWTAVALGWLALRMGDAIRWLQLPFLLLPSVLFLNASSSQDALLLPVAALLAALVSRAVASRRDFTCAELLLLTVLLILAGMARAPNAGLALVLFLPLAEHGKLSWRRLAGPCSAFLAVLAATVGWLLLVAPLGVDHADEAEPELQRAFLLAHPFAALQAIFRGTAEAAVDAIHRGLYVMGWNDLLAPRWLMFLLATAVAGVVLLAPSLPLRRGRGRLLLALAVLLPLLGISLAEYVIWTPPGLATVYGIQPRYWLPVAPLGLLLVKSWRWRAGRVWFGRSPLRGRMLLSAAALLASVACSLPFVAAQAFYREGLARLLWVAMR